MAPVNALVIGGGFYGCVIAAFLARREGVGQVVLVEREKYLMSRASHNNQARVHNGYHYPRSFVTAHRSRVNFPGFVSDWSPAIRSDFTKLYAIARRNSKVTSRQFLRFCQEIGAQVEPADEKLKGLFDNGLIDNVFVAQEYAFDSRVLASLLSKELAELGVEIRCDTRALEVNGCSNSGLCVRLVGPAGEEGEVQTKWAFNCTYSGLNQIAGGSDDHGASLKQEITEIAQVRVPPGLSDLGVTVMDGPFFSLMPFPPRGLHTLSHVRYTPHLSWMDQKGVDPYERLANYGQESRVEWMIRDAARYMPAIRDVRYEGSLYEVKTVLQKNEVDDGRPILFHRDRSLPGLFSVLGGKIDNIYDVLDRIQYVL